MKRDPEIIREILLALEANDDDPLKMKTIEIENVSTLQISYHVQLMFEAGFIHAIDGSTMDGHDWIPKRLKWDGHELLEAIRDDTVWRRTKERVGMVGGWTLPILRDVAASILRQQLGL